MQMLTGKQKSYLRSEAHHLQPLFQVGKHGVNAEMVTGVGDALEKRELLKVSILQNCPEDRGEVAEKLAHGTGAELVQTIGNTVVLYRESKENKRLMLPRG